MTKQKRYPFAKLSIKQAATTLGVSNNTILRAIDSGALPAETTVARMTVIDAGELAAWFEARGGAR